MRSVLATLILLGACNFADAASLKSAFAQGKFVGQLRAYNNTLAFQHAPDKYGTSFGGKLKYETDAQQLLGFSAGAAYYTANNLETNHDDPSARAPFTPTVNVDILGEAYLRWQGLNTVVTGGNQLINTPFANPSDAFMIPVTYTGYSIENASVEHLTLSAHFLTNIKVRESPKFNDTGAYALSRLGGTTRNTAGTSVYGAKYEKEGLKVQGWHYVFPDIFLMEWLQADYEFTVSQYTSYLSAQYGLENDTGDKFLGNIDSSLIGLQAGIKFRQNDFSIGFNSISGDTYLAPYTFFTDALYTNSMITGMSNVSAGNAWKFTLQSNWTPQLWTKLSYSILEFNGGKDSSELDGDLRYKFAGDFENLAVLFRLGYRDGENAPPGLSDLLEYRTQVQYTF